jgi:hypothetical protein
MPVIPVPVRTLTTNAFLFGFGFHDDSYDSRSGSATTASRTGTMPFLRLLRFRVILFLFPGFLRWDAESTNCELCVRPPAWVQTRPFLVPTHIPTTFCIHHMS